MKKLLTIIFLVFVFISCSQKDNPGISTIDINGNQATVLIHDKIDKKPTLKLSDIAEDLKLIPLETSPGCMIGYAYFHVYDKYIVAVNPYEKVLLFDGNGKFVKQICGSGKGPREIQRAFTTVDESKDILYISDEAKDYFMSWDLNTGDYIKDIPKVYKGRYKNMFYTDENTLLLAPLVGYPGSGKYYLFEQDLEGKLVREIEAPEIERWSDSNVKLMHYNGSGYSYKPINNDSIFYINNTDFNPAWIFDFGPNNENLKGKAGGKSFRYFFESPRWFAGYVSIIDRVETTSVEGGVSSRTFNKIDNLLVDKKNNSAIIFDIFQNDFLGQDTTYLSRFELQKNSLLTNVVNALDLVELAEKVLNNPNSDPELTARMQKIKDEISIEDNPVLLVGKLRK